MQSSNSYVGLVRVPTRLLIVGGLHMVVVWALINGLHVRLSVLPKPTDLTISMLTEDRPPPVHMTPTEVPRTTFTLREDQPVIPKLTDPILETAPVITQTAPSVFTEPTPMPAEPQPVLTGAALDPRHPLTQPEYPMAARRLDESGKVALAVLIGANGRVLDVKVAQSSGWPVLDEAAMAEARTHWRLRPATRNGVPVEQWLTLGVVFRLESR